MFMFLQTPTNKIFQDEKETQKQSSCCWKSLKSERKKTLKWTDFTFLKPISRHANNDCQSHDPNFRIVRSYVLRSYV